MNLTTAASLPILFVTRTVHCTHRKRRSTGFNTSTASVTLLAVYYVCIWSMLLIRQSAVLSFTITATRTRSSLKKVLQQPAFNSIKPIAYTSSIIQQPQIPSFGRRTITAVTMSESNAQSNAPTSTKTISTATISKKNIVVDPFCFRQFREYYQEDKANDAKDYTGTIFDISISDLERIVNERYTSNSNEDMLQDGYAPFCKHLFIVNDFTNAVVNVLPITKDNEHLLRTKYMARNEKELPVLIRYFPKELIVPNQSLPIAKYLDLILYSREQINLENQATTKTTSSDPTATTTTTTTTTETAPWGIVSIKAQDIDTELPMTPITNMRNALGKEYGGSGIPLDYDKYMECINYWNDHATIS